MKIKKNLFLLILSFLFIRQIFSQQLNSYSQFNQDDVNGFDRLIMNSYSQKLDYAGTAMMGLTLLTPAVLFTAPADDYWKIGVEYAETIAVAYGVKELCKLCVNRARPYMYFDGAPESKIAEGDWNNSFISGHATLSFAAASFTSFLFYQYYPDSQWTIPVIISSYALAGVTSYLRLESGNHFMTDVLCGAAAGTVIGILVPLLNSLWIKPSYISENTQVMISPAAFTMQIKF